MIHVETTLSHAGFFGAGRRSDLLRAIKVYGIYRTTLRHLRALSDKQLDDLGFRREDLKSVARAAAYAH
ncbi:DUF1127 domain-containing protein [Amaricoccus sp.]|uniref:DUF1127 domain-containing protein n=1 Tax=Amaricoccus sp. TaxID=1872485 RepID=UPI00260D2E0A|nr:DUF1127 domain-containing protein [uncultured Amaricoccus sp.]